MVQQRNEVPGGVYFFISIEAKGKAPVFRESSFKTRVERRWMANMEDFPQAKAPEFVVNDMVLHAIIVMSTSVSAPEEVLDEICRTFQASVLEDWQGESELWNPKPKVRPITKQSELRSLRDFIVQKMLGGKELSRLEELDEDEEDNYWN